MGFLDTLKKLLGIGRQAAISGEQYVDRRTRTRTGKLRAKAGTDERGERLEIDRAIYGVEGLSKSAKRVYVYLSAIADKDGYCFPFYKTIAKRTKLSESTVSKAIRDLEARGLITRKQRISRRGQSSNLYQVQPVPVGRDDTPANGKNGGD
jgi:predicted transcriptional regulator